MNIGVIAGGGQFPILFSKTAKNRGYTVVAAAFKNEADISLEQYVDKIEWIHIGQIKKLINFFKQHQTSEAVMMGTVNKSKALSDIRPDSKALTLLAKMKITHDDGLLSAFANLLEKEGIQIKESTFLLPELLAEEGCWTKKKPDKEQQEDIDHGWEIAKSIGRLDIGQCIVMGKGSVLAVEAVDGTDATIRRGGRLGNGKAVVIKICKPTQDLRFDIPAVGLNTIKTMHDSKANVLVIEAQKAVVFDKKEMIEYADKHGISIIAI